MRWAKKKTVTIKGSDTMVLIGQRWAEKYMQAFPTETIQINGGGSGTGFAALLNGSTDICQASRPIKDKERQGIKDKFQYEVTEIPVLKDGIAIYVHSSNPIQSITMNQLEAIYTGGIKNWKELGGADNQILVYGRENSSGTYEFFKEHVLLGKDFANYVQTLSGTAAILNSVSKDKFSIGYGGVAYASGDQSEIKLLPVKGREENSQPMLPTSENVEKNTYPISRDLYFYIVGKPSEKVQKFVDWVLSEEGQAHAAENLSRRIITGVASVAIFAIAFIFIFIFSEAKEVFFNSNVRGEVFATIGSDNWQPVSDRPKYGILPLLIGTLKTTFIAMLIAIPISVLAAIYSACIAPSHIREILKPAIELLAGIPSVVIGFFALAVIATVVQNITGATFRLNAFVGGIAISLTAIPIIFTLSEEALTAVPKSLWEASYALGATRWESIIKIAVPTSLSGIFAGILLGMGRAIGETLIVIMATGNASINSWSFFDSTRTLTATIGAEMADVVYGSTHYQMLFFIGVILFLFTFALKAVSEFIIKEKFEKKNT
ncbi:hypothetical protein CHS0354_000474 [Potamilus streckersoni]|uniref:ABC transmembrane type-1 domain-containing protein n=1 Tax=Potamilus streckersoni TaxID=2493646 RepID=A0AAE0T6P2_9BIVA|nr:hypothetical protein CHS0354_000474 [Potamilus streckersoni]